MTSSPFRRHSYKVCTQRVTITSSFMVPLIVVFLNLYMIYNFGTVTKSRREANKGKLWSIFVDIMNSLLVMALVTKHLKQILIQIKSKVDCF